MRIVFLGAPGVGKGTQADRMASRSGYPRISTGDILREAVRNKTALGLQAKAYMDQGQLVPDSVVIGLVKERLAEPSAAKGFLLDGFPRTVQQAEELDKVLAARGQALDAVVNVRVPREEVVRRLTGRRNCPACQAVFHVDFAPSRQDGACDRCGTALIQRSDDRKETVEARLMVYDEQTAPLIAYYQRRGLVSEIDGFGPIQEVEARLQQLLAARGIA